MFCVLPSVIHISDANLISRLFCPQTRHTLKLLSLAKKCIELKYYIWKVPDSHSLTIHYCLTQISFGSILDCIHSACLSHTFLPANIYEGTIALLQFS